MSDDEWEIDRLDLDAYLHRIGYAGDLDPTGATLRAVHLAHVAAIPFENLDIVLGREVSVDLDSVQDKLITRHRGGYCYEHGVLFAAVLERLGYSVDRLLARVGGDEQRPRPFSHMTLRVQAGGERWLADVGFGLGLLEPLPWGDTGPHPQGGWAYRLVAVGERTWQVRERQGESWSALYSFSEEPQHASDVVVANYFTSNHPSSPFVGRPVVIRKEPHSRLRLHGRQLSLTRPDGSSEERRLTDPELGDALCEEFGLRLSRQETAVLLDSLAA